MKTLRNALERRFPVKVDYLDERAVERLAHHLLHTFMQDVQQKELVILCIGTDRSTGDAWAPWLAANWKAISRATSRFTARSISPFTPSTWWTPLAAFPAPTAIRTSWPSMPALASSSTLARSPSTKGPSNRAGVQKNLPAVGSLHMTGIVNVGGFMEYFVLQNTRLSVVMKMADVMAEAILHAARRWKPKETAVFR